MSFKKEFLKLHPNVTDKRIKSILFEEAEKGNCKIDEDNHLCYTSDVAKKIALL